jgi:DNA adenine methylase
LPLANAATFGDTAGMKSSYPGGKAGSGVYQRLINEIPPHDTYIAAFAGRDAIARWMRPSEKVILIARKYAAEFVVSRARWPRCRRTFDKQS